MKKLMTIVLAAALMFAAAGQAQAALETSGEFRARFWNLSHYLNDHENQEFWDQRLRLNLDWPIAEGVKLHARADIMEGFWGDNLVSASQPAPGAPITYSASANSRPAVAWDQVNLAFAVPGTPLNVSVGRQEASWGPGNFTKSDNRDRFKLTGKLGEAVTLLYTYDKYTEVGSLHGVGDLGDRRQHSVGAISKLADFSVGLIYGLVLDETAAGADTALSAIDAYAAGKVGPADLKLEVTYGFGETDNTGVADLDLSGLLVYAGVSAPVGPATVGAEFSYATGNDPGTADENEGVLKAEYQSPFWSVILFNNFDLNGYGGESQAGATDTGVSNAMAGKLSVAAPAGPLSLYGAVVYAQRLEETAVDAGNDEALGTEINLVANYAVSEKVTLTVGGGYLFPGDYYGDDAEDVWGAVVAFTTTF